MSATLAPGGLRVEIALAGAPPLTGADLQVSFREERNESYMLASKARELAKADAGAGLAAWTRILDEYPFETRLVEEAEQARTRLLQTGHAELEALRADYERARFFGLADLFRRCGDQTRALAKRYTGSEIEPEALALAGEIDAERARLEASRRAFERTRLEAVLGVVEGERWQGLAERVRAALERP
jgi:hypothetical protein